MSGGVYRVNQLAVEVLCGKSGPARDLAKARLEAVMAGMKVALDDDNGSCACCGEVDEQFINLVFGADAEYLGVADGASVCTNCAQEAAA